MKIFSPIHLKNLLNMIDLPKLSFLFLFALITACGGFNTGVKKSDTQKINTVKYGTLVAAEPVKITGESTGIGALTGGLIGFVVGCGEGILDDDCRDAAAVVGTIGGAIVGYVAGSKLGDHTGFQYVVDVDDTDDDISIVQSGKDQIPIGSRVTIAIGANTRIIISESVSYTHLTLPTICSV